MNLLKNVKSVFLFKQWQISALIYLILLPIYELLIYSSPDIRPYNVFPLMLVGGAMGLPLGIALVYCYIIFFEAIYRNLPFKIKLEQ